MPRQLSPQSRFLLRASVAFVPLLALWWLALRPPLLAWTRLSSDFLLNAAPGATLQTGVHILPNGAWTMQLPVQVAGVWRNIRVDAEPRLPTQLTVGLPLFWAILLAAPRTRGIGRAAAIGTLVLLLIPPAGVLIYAFRVVQIYVFPHAPGILRAALSVADYLASSVAPYLGPVLVALALHPGLRREVLGQESSSPAE